MLSMHCQGTIYSKPACTSRLLVEQRQIPIVGNAIFFRGIYIYLSVMGGWGQKFLVLDNAIRESDNGENPRPLGLTLIRPLRPSTCVPYITAWVSLRAGEPYALQAASQGSESL